MAFDFKKVAAKAQEQIGKLAPALEKIWPKSPHDYLAEGDEAQKAQKKNPIKRSIEASSSLAKVLTGSVGMLGEYYFPTELIGGTCPRVRGEEEDIVWNAAAEACDSERVHIVWQSVENRIWYLAVRSAELASHANSWCPFASLLPGMKDAATPPVCYTYYSDESASMMTITQDGLQIYRGTSLIVRAKAERTAREMGNAPIIELVQDKIMSLTPTPWYSLSLFEDRARRIIAALAVLTAMTLAGISFFVWLLASMSLIASKHDLTRTLEQTTVKTMDLMRNVEKLRASPMRQQIADFSKLNDDLLALNGILQIYEIRDGKPRWRAIVPINVTADRINEMGGKNIETNDQGVVIGNQAEIDYEAKSGGKH